MSSADYTAFPDVLPAGVTVTVRRELGDYLPADGWTLRAHLRGPVALDLEAAPDGAAHLFTITPTATGTLAQGTYQFEERATGPGGVVRLTDGRRAVSVIPDLAAATGDAFRLWAEKMLEALEAALVASAGSLVVSYTVDGHGAQEMARKEAMDLRDRLKRELRAGRPGAAFSRPVVMSFRGTGAGP